MTDPNIQFPDIADYDIERQQLARRRKIAESLMATRMPLARVEGNNAILPGAGNTLAAGFDRAWGNYQNNNIDQAELQNRMAEREAASRFFTDLATPGTKEKTQLVQGQGPLLEPPTEQVNVPLSPAEEANRRIKLYGQGMNIPSLRATLTQQLGQELDYPRAREIELAKAQLEQNRIAAQDARMQAQFGQQNALLDKRLAGQKELKGMPTIHITNSGGGVPGGDGKPLSPAQEKAALELGSNRSNLQMLTDTFKDEYSGDIRSTIERKFGEAAGGLASESTQEMQRWWANQAMFDELPQRHEMFGATLTAGEKASWNAAAISENMSPKMIRERLAIRSKIYDDAQERMRNSAVAGGKSAKQFDAAAGNKPVPAAAKPVAPQQSSARTTVNSKDEFNALPAGTKWQTPDGRKGTK